MTDQINLTICRKPLSDGSYVYDIHLSDMWHTPNFKRYDASRELTIFQATSERNADFFTKTLKDAINKYTVNTVYDTKYNY